MEMSDLPEIDLDSPDFHHGVERADASTAHLREGLGMARSQRGIELFTYDLSSALIKDQGYNIGMHRRLASMGMAPGPAFDMICNIMVNIEGDEHARMRKACMTFFTLRGAEKLRSDVRAWVDKWVQEGLDGEEFDFQAAIGRQLPSVVFCKLIGEPLEMAPIYAQLAEDIMKHAQPPQPGFAEIIEKAAIEAELRMRQVIKDRRARPGDDLVSHMLIAEKAGEVDEDDIFHLVVTVLIGSTDTTDAQLCLNLAALSDNPSQWQVLRKNPELVPTAVMELIRFKPGVWTLSRSPLQDTVYRGINLTPDDAIWPLVFSANRDPLAFADPSRLDVTRAAGKTPLNFGTGIHMCLGRMITLLEQQEVLSSLLTHWSEFEVTDSEFQGAMYSTVATRMTTRFVPDVRLPSR